MAKKKLTSVLVLLLALTALHACGDPKETCTCTCTCGDGDESTIEGTDGEEDCSNQCDTKCGGTYTTNHDCTTKG